MEELSPEQKRIWEKILKVEEELDRIFPFGSGYDVLDKNKKEIDEISETLDLLIASLFKLS